MMAHRRQCERFLSRSSANGPGRRIRKLLFVEQGRLHDHGELSADQGRDFDIDEL